MLGSEATLQQNTHASTSSSKTLNNTTIAGTPTFCHFYSSSVTNVTSNDLDALRLNQLLAPASTPPTLLQHPRLDEQQLLMDVDGSLNRNSDNGGNHGRQQSPAGLLHQDGGVTIQNTHASASSSKTLNNTIIAGMPTFCHFYGS